MMLPHSKFSVLSPQLGNTVHHMPVKGLQGICLCYSYMPLWCLFARNTSLLATYSSPIKPHSHIQLFTCQPVKFK